MSMMTAPPVFLYRYDISIFSHKAEHILLLKNVPYKSVTVSPILPRPEITDLLGLKYRRIPILAIGNDIYCDTSLIAAALERRFPESKTLFPRRKGGAKADTGLIQAFVRHFSDDVLFFNGVMSMSWENRDPKFIEDRSKHSYLIGLILNQLMGAPIQALTSDPTARPRGKVALYAQMALIEEQLKDDREWLFDTETPGFADAAVYAVLAWLRSPSFREAGIGPIFDEGKFNFAMKWLERMASYIDALKSSNGSLIEPKSGEDAGKEIATAAQEPNDVIGFDETVAQWLGLKRGQKVSFAPSQGYNASRSIFPSRKGGGGPDKGLIRAFSKYFVDDAMLPAAVPLYPWENLDISVVNDRTKFMGKGPDIVGEMLGKRGKGMADLDAQLTLVEEQIEDGREWLFDTERPGLADVAVYWVCAWCKEFGASVLHINEGKFPYTLKWFERMRDCIEAEGTQNGNALWEDVDGDAAGKEAAAAQCEMHEFDQQIAKYLGVQKEQTVSVAPVGDGLSYNVPAYNHYPMSSQPKPILYRYEISAFCRKIENILLLKGIEHKRVDVSPVLPRPEITEAFGLGYRRMPVMTIGNDIYCDTSLMIPVLERRFPASKSIFPPRKGGGAPDRGLIRAFSKYFGDDAMLPAAVPLVPWEHTDPVLVKDRIKFLGQDIDLAEHMMAKRGKGMADLDAQLALVEEQVEDGREWLFDTERPGLADVAVYWVCAWFRGFGTGLLDGKDNKYPETLKVSVFISRALMDVNEHSWKWFERMKSHLEAEEVRNKVLEEVDSDTAGKEAAAGRFEPYDVRGFDEQIAKYLGVQKGQAVSVAPAGDGLPYNAKDYSTIGKLVSLDKDEICLEIEGKLGTFRCHFPRLGFNVHPVQ
ncbi:hypothetical protein VNI00_011037 [Paramarasmius palmivorus]|uniref:GST N-terminal domain-containing protein n=1 Tax=Paramarasmius palmivorus TaxID=297713 RepID=A0AAW0CF05_9AGAR